MRAVRFSDFKKTRLHFLRFFEMTYQKVVKSHKKVSSLLNVYRNFRPKTPACYGPLWVLLSHTVLSCIVSCGRTSEQDV